MSLKQSLQLFLYSRFNNLLSDSLVIQWRFVNRVQKQMNAFLEVFMCSTAVATRGQCDLRLCVGMFESHSLNSASIYKHFGSLLLLKLTPDLFMLLTLNLQYVLIPFLFNFQGFTELILIDLIKIFDENELEVWILYLNHLLNYAKRL